MSAIAASEFAPVVDVKLNMCNISQEEASMPIEESKSNTWLHLWCTLTNIGSKCYLNTRDVCSCEYLVKLILCHPHCEWFYTRANMKSANVAQRWVSFFAFLRSAIICFPFSLVLPFIMTLSQKYYKKDEVIFWVNPWGRCEQLNYRCDNTMIEKAGWCNNS